MLSGGAGFDPFFLAYNRFSMIEHTGTHIDAPNHLVADEQVAAQMDAIDEVKAFLSFIAF